MRALPAVAAHGVSSNPDAYVYLAESIRAWPDQAGAGRADRRGPAGPDVALAQPDRRDRRPAPGHASHATAARRRVRWRGRTRWAAVG